LANASIPGEKRIFPLFDDFNLQFACGAPINLRENSVLYWVPDLQVIVTGEHAALNVCDRQQCPEEAVRWRQYVKPNWIHRFVTPQLRKKALVRLCEQGQIWQRN
jgi:hypothetical protein